MNNLDDQGAEEIANLIKYNDIKELGISIVNYNIGFNSIKSNGAKAIGEALKTNKTLKKLHLGIFLYNIELNEIQSEGAKDISNALISNQCLIDLNIG